MNQNVSDETLSQVFEANKIKVFFDAVGGDDAARIFKLLPNGAQLVTYGRLSRKPAISIETTDLLARGKSARGF